jgi:hypothetical protein
MLSLSKTVRLPVMGAEVDAIVDYGNSHAASSHAPVRTQYYGRFPV